MERNAQIDLSLRPEVTPFPDAATSTISYVVKDPSSSACAIVDSVLDFDYAAGRIGFAHADRIAGFVRERGLQVEWHIETHVHADHLSAAPYLQSLLGGRIGIGERIVQVQETFGKVFNEGTGFRRDGSQFDRLFAEGDLYRIGSMTAIALHTPGHTPACMTHVVGDAAFVGDTLFMPDAGTARADFPGGDAHELYRSVRRILDLPGELRLFMCHDYGPNGREIRWETTVAEERARNIHVRDGVTEHEFVGMRERRDATLAMPRLIVPSLQVNMRAGHLPPPDADGRLFLKVPLNTLGTVEPLPSSLSLQTRRNAMSCTDSEPKAVKKAAPSIAAPSIAATASAAPTESPVAAHATLPRLNEPAPDFSAQTTFGPRSLSDYRGKWLVLFSHPADFTPVCTTEFMAFAQAAPEFGALNTELLGLSIDSVFSHLAWTRNIQEKFGVTIGFPIIEDLSMNVARAYGMIHPGAADTSAVRATFIIDDKGILRAMVYYPMTNGRSVAEILRLVQGLQHSLKNGVATPEGWHPGDKVLVGAPKTEAELQARLKEGLETKDWYFSMKPAA